MSIQAALPSYESTYSPLLVLFKNTLEKLFKKVDPEDPILVLATEDSPCVLFQWMK